MYQPLLESHLTLFRCLTRINCPECGIEFPGQLAMKKHYWVEHMFAAKSPREFTCPYGCPDFVTPMPEIRYSNHMRQKHMVAPTLDGCEILREGQTTDKVKCANCPKEYRLNETRQMVNHEVEKHMNRVHCATYCRRCGQMYCRNSKVSKYSKFNDFILTHPRVLGNYPFIVQMW